MTIVDSWMTVCTIIILAVVLWRIILAFDQLRFDQRRDARNRLLMRANINELIELLCEEDEPMLWIALHNSIRKYRKWDGIDVPVGHQDPGERQAGNLHLQEQ
jgi:hypothetical protein